MSDTKKQYEPCTCIIDLATEKAIRVRFIEPESNAPLWVPRSVCEDGEEVGIGDEEIHVEAWWLRTHGVHE